MSGAYYNEFDPYAAQWLRNLIKAGLIAPGDVDERSIEDVIPSELAGYTQCHFFAGVGVWSLALRGAGWNDTRPVWTGSCPCQPFSSAGEGLGFADERHLWPAFNYLITERRPTIVFGEQVAAKAVEPWVDLVHADLEGLGYSFGCVPFSSAGVGAPHIRDRAYWLAYSNLPEQDSGWTSIWEQSLCDQYGQAGESDSAGATNGWWRNVDWIRCTDGFWRPVESGAFPLADGVANRMGKLRAYGNAINAQQAKIWIETVMECIA